MQALLIEAKDSPTISGILYSNEQRIVNGQALFYQDDRLITFNPKDPTDSFRSMQVVSDQPIETGIHLLTPITIPHAPEKLFRGQRTGIFNGQVEPIDPGYSSLDRANREAQPSQRVAYSDRSQTTVIHTTRLIRLSDAY